MMGRAERRRTQKLEQKAKTATYNLTKEQLNIAVREQVGKELERIKQTSSFAPTTKRISLYHMRGNKSLTFIDTLNPPPKSYNKIIQIAA